MRGTSPTRDLVTPWEDLDAAADHAPTAPAVTVGDARFTYQQLRQEAQDVARGLTALGVGEGDRVTLHMTNSRELLASYYGCFRLGATAWPLNVRLTLAELRPMLDTIGPVAHLSQPALDAVTAEALTGVNRIVTGDLEPGNGVSSWDSLLEIGRALDLPEVPQGTQPAVLFPTSGTTGTPKFVAHSATTLAATAGTLTYEIVPVVVRRWSCRRGCTHSASTCGCHMYVAARTSSPCRTPTPMARLTVQRSMRVIGWQRCRIPTLRCWRPNTGVLDKSALFATCVPAGMCARTDCSKRARTRSVRHCVSSGHRRRSPAR